ncbi:CD276 antigen isoform X2 [Etheostoma spectabile]|uniref:CD276 antigen isoform X2 n=1 Tax=Etheostoma spectabile TaxID=54343 RepID=UPI0013AEF722|nr:CD276 antigen-like isoform X2 [Etheostoma spectabile]
MGHLSGLGHRILLWLRLLILKVKEGTKPYNKTVHVEFSVKQSVHHQETSPCRGACKLNMASMGILLFFTVIYIRTGHTNTAFVKVECQAGKVGVYGQQSLLQCVVKTTQDNTEIRVVTWKKEGLYDPLLVFYKEKIVPRQGYSFAEPSWNERNMNVSLLITNTSVKHEGVYKCEVMTNSGDGSDSTSLKVTAKYKKPTIHSDPQKILSNTDVTLTCKSSEGYPKGQLRWFDEHNVEWTISSQKEEDQTESGLFNLCSKLYLRKGSTFTKYTCKVFNASDGKEDEATFEVHNASGSVGNITANKSHLPATKIVAPVVVIGSLIVGLLLALLIYRKRSQSDHRGLATSDYDDGDQEGDKTCQVSLA